MDFFSEKFPDDADGQVLKNLYEDGVDFKQPQNVDFFVAVPDKESGEAILKLLREDGFNSELEQDEKSEEWTCYCFVRMLLNHQDIIDIQKRLDELSEPFGGYSDGWGVMVD
ncbi:ribonuclease E inhibitor RraB [Neobacillus sp. YIM B06451]|uniref:ribonuclease E inhibitor RraB n=1 Tax=Neobacillus sp. YIM B06451 TaxID=3070994 RepID=UPI00292FD820|nr:ribonuclease E inhibitor RraB [Neobacillus sp. YIM B06451]